MDPRHPQEELCNTGPDYEKLIREKERSRRVSFSENTEAHFFDRDDEDCGETPPQPPPSPLITPTSVHVDHDLDISSSASPDANTRFFEPNTGSATPRISAIRLEKRLVEGVRVRKETHDGDKDLRSQKEYGSAGDFLTPLGRGDFLNSPLGSSDLSFLIRTDPAATKEKFCEQNPFHKPASPRIMTTTVTRLEKVLKELPEAIERLIFPSIRNLDTQERIEDLVANPYQGRKTEDRRAEAKWLQETLVYEQTKLLSLCMKKDRLCKKVQQLQSGIQEVNRLKISVKNVIQNDAKDSSNIDVTSSSLSVNLSKENTVNCHGTVNCFVIYNGGILIGVDSRASFTSQEGVHHVRFDDGIKYKELVSPFANTPAVGITAAGDFDRNMIVWEYAEWVVKSGVTDIDDLAKAISDFLKLPLGGKRGCEFFIAGFSMCQKKFVVHLMGDGQNDRIFLSGFYAIGSGCVYAMNSLKSQKLIPEMTMDDTLAVIARAMLDATTYDPSCGGNLKVYRLAEPGLVQTLTVQKLFDTHPIDLLLTGVFNDFCVDSVLFFFTEEDNSKMNYSVLNDCLLRSSMASKTLPACFGKLSTKVNMFIVTYDEKIAEQMFLLHSQSIRKYDDTLVRGIRFHLGSMVHDLLITRATLAVLKEAKKML